MNVTVVSKTERGHFRAGRFWPPQPVQAEVTEAQLAELRADKRIAVLDGPAPVADSPAAEKSEAERAQGEKRRGTR